MECVQNDKNKILQNFKFFFIRYGWKPIKNNCIKYQKKTF